MLKNFFQSVFGEANQLTTYKIGLLQAKAYRLLKQKTSSLLEKYNISAIEWALLGLLFDQKEGYKLIEIADLLGVEAPFVTVMIDSLEHRRLVKRTTSNQDKRAKRVVLTAQGVTKVPQIESAIRAEMKDTLHGLTAPELMMHLKVLRTMVKNLSE